MVYFQGKASGKDNFCVFVLHIHSRGGFHSYLPIHPHQRTWLFFFSIQLYVTVDHDYPEDLQISLVSPSGIVSTFCRTHSIERHLSLSLLYGASRIMLVIFFLRWICFSLCYFRAMSKKLFSDINLKCVLNFRFPSSQERFPITVVFAERFNKYFEHLHSTIGWLRGRKQLGRVDIPIFRRWKQSGLLGTPRGRYSLDHIFWE